MQQLLLTRPTGNKITTSGKILFRKSTGEQNSLTNQLTANVQNDHAQSIPATQQTV